MNGDYGYTRYKSLASRKTCRQIKEYIRGIMLYRYDNIHNGVVNNIEVVNKVFDKSINFLEDKGYIFETKIQEFIDEAVGNDLKYNLWYTCWRISSD